MELPKFATQEEALNWGQEFITTIKNGGEIFTEHEAGQAVNTEYLTENFSQKDLAIHQIQRVSTVLALIRHSLADLIPNRGTPVYPNQTYRSINAATFMLESVEDELDSACVALIPSSELHRASQEMATGTGKASNKKK